MRTVIFGLAELSSLAWYCLTHDSPHDVVGFAVDAAYRDRDTLHGLPVVDFEWLEDRFAPGETALLVPLGGRGVNGLRMERHLAGKTRGYATVSYVSSRAIVPPDLAVGENVMIHDGAIVQPFARVGNNCMLRSGCHVSHHAIVGDHCFLAAHAVVAGGATLGERCFIGLNATVLDGVRVAPRCIVGAGAVLTRDTEPDGVYVGSPARRSTRPASQSDLA